MDLRLRIIINEQGETTDLELGKSTSIGRSDSNRVQIPQSYISQKHAVISKSEDGSYIIEDCDSKNGTFVNDTPIESPTEIKDGDVLRFGLAACTVVDADPDAPDPHPVIPASSSRKLVVMTGKRSEKKSHLYPSSYETLRKSQQKSGKEKKTYLADRMKSKKTPAAKLYNPTSV